MDPTPPSPPFTNDTEPFSDIEDIDGYYDMRTAFVEREPDDRLETRRDEMRTKEKTGELVPDRTVQKRKSDERIPSAGKRAKENNGSRVADSTAFGGLSMDDNSSNEVDQFKTLKRMIKFQREQEEEQKKAQGFRVFKEHTIRGEEDKFSRGHCCNCNASGSIMTLPKCRYCLHNRCDGCDIWEEEELSFDMEPDPEVSADEKSEHLDITSSQHSAHVYAKLVKLGREMNSTMGEADKLPYQTEEQRWLMENLRDVEKIWNRWLKIGEGRLCGTTSELPPSVVK